MAVPTLIELAEAGAHFGHHRSLTFPKAKEFVYMIKSNVALINLEQTQEAISAAQSMLAEYRAANKNILFVGTKRSVRNSLKEVAESIGASYITERWFGGTLTNFETILANIKKMNELEEFLSDDKSGKLTKKERLRHQNQLNRYHRFLGGLKTLKRMPDLIVLASATEDKIAIDEATQLHIPIIAITDTDMNPDRITCPIPANDDAPKAVDLILRSIVEAPTKKATAKTEETVVVEEKPKKTVKKAKETVAKKTTAKKAAKVSKK
jgi:small subunit ribosomal protein S2